MPRSPTPDTSISIAPLNGLYTPGTWVGYLFDSSEVTLNSDGSYTVTLAPGGDSGNNFTLSGIYGNPDATFSVANTPGRVLQIISSNPPGGMTFQFTYGAVVGHTADALLVAEFGNYGGGGATGSPDGNYLIIADQDLTQTLAAGTTLTFTQSSAVAYVPPCFAAGTRLRTPSGEVAVETLRAGDLVLTAAGAARPVRWVGRRRVDLRRHPRPEQVRPVRIAAGAFADGVPARDLLLSPDHAVFTQGVLIPVRELINGITIAPLPVATVNYHHIEMDRHDLLLAEGLLVESFLDTGVRRNFAEAGAPVALHADFAAPDMLLSPDWMYLLWESLGCARLVVWGPELDRARLSLNLRAAALANAPAERERRWA
jgi:hypothetical protein